MSNSQKPMDAIIACFDRDDMAEAERLCRTALARDPHNQNVVRLLGVAVRKGGKNRIDEARQILAQAVEKFPTNGLLQFELGNVFVDLHQAREAYECFLNAIQHKPNLQQGYVNLSAVTEEQERFIEALDWAAKALKLNPNCPLANYNAANALREMGRFAEAVTHYQASIRHNPNFPKAHWNLGICQLLLGNYREGWKLFELRQSAGEVTLDRYPQPLWDGSSLANKTIVVHAEQGIGDEVIFASCVPDLLPLAKKCVIVCEPRLANLFSRSFPAATVFGWLRLKDLSPAPLPVPCDVQIPAGSLPLYLRTKKEDFPQRESFLTPDPKLVAQWKQRFAALGPGYKIGVSWRAGGKPAERRKRSIPLADWAEILTTPGVQFVNLQYSDASEEIDAVQNSPGVTIHDWEQGDPLIDMDEYAAKIAALDLVISVGNATVHMAGALGTPAWAMLPQIPSWRWMAHGDYSPWYTSVRLFRQTERGGWPAVLREVSSLLRESIGVEAAHIGQGGRESISPAVGDVIASGSVGEIDSRPLSRDESQWLTVTDVSNQGSIEQLPKLIDEAETAANARDFSHAEKLYRQVLQLQPRHAVALYGLGVVARETGRSELAIRSFQRSLSLYDALPHHHYQLGCALFDASRFDEAERSLGRTIELDPQFAKAYNLLGVLYHHDQRLNEAAQCLHRAIKVKPHFAMAHVNLGRLMLETGHVEEAIVCFQRALGCDENVFDAAYCLGLAYERLGQRIAAIRALERAAHLRPNDVNAKSRLAAIHAELDERDIPLVPAREDLLNLAGRATDSHEKRSGGSPPLVGPHWNAEELRNATFEIRNKYE